MSTSKTGIEWTDRTWNPVSGCTKVSPGCKNCYAETVANRFWKGRPFTDVQCHADRLDQPLRWKKPSRIFVNSMSDLFHEDVPWDFITGCFRIMADSERHTYQILTKRPDRAREFVEHIAEDIRTKTPGWFKIHFWPSGIPWPLPNVHLGVSVENQETADERIPILLQTPAAVRFLSVEPLLEAVNLRWYLEKRFYQFDHPVIPPIDWVIVGGESGPGARPCNIEWIRGIVAQCKAAGVKCFVKQVGSRPDGWWTNENGPRFNRHALKDRKGGDINEWPEDLRIREFPA